MSLMPRSSDWKLSSDDELQNRLAKLYRLRELHHQRTQAELANFRQTYPAPGDLAVTLDKRTVQTPALRRIDADLVGLTDGVESTKLMIFMAPQEGKSSRVSNWYPLWLLASDPTLRIAIVSYSQDKALRWGRWLRRNIQSRQLNITLRSDSRASDRFETDRGGSVVCVGIDGGITGEPVDVLIIDDPVRGRAEAESKRYRERAWEWWESNGATRLSSRARVVLMMTRWHADDLAGRLLKNEPGEWKVLRIPVVRQPGIEVEAPDGESVYHPNGELKSVQGRKQGYFHHLKSVRSAYVWRSVYDQDPVAAEGNLFKRDDFRFWEPIAQDWTRHDALNGEKMVMLGQEIFLADCWRFITVDLAASTATSSDYTVASCWAITPDGDLALLDRKRGRIEEVDHWDLIKPLCERWQAPDVFVERGFIGTTLIIDATKAGIRVLPLDPDKDKLTRALPATYRVKAHRVWFPAGVVWLDEWCDELAEFPTGAHDDQVDTFAYAARITSAHWVPDESQPYKPLPQTIEDAAHTSATGTAAGLDFSTAEW